MIRKLICSLALAFLGSIQVASAADGKFEGVFHKSGTAKAMPVGDDIVVLAFDEYGYITSDDNAGPFNNVSCRCVGTAQVMNGSGKAKGQCVVMDPTGDQYAISWEFTEFTPGKRIVGKAAFIGGTGKFKGITGGGPWESSVNEVRPVADGTYQGWSKLHFTYQMQ
jgi:hypothetical protein